MVTSEASLANLELRAEPLSASESGEWDRFVELHPEGRFCHLWGFRHVLELAYGYECVYARILDGSKLVGVFPSIVSRKGSGSLISQPFNEYGGPLTCGFDDAAHKGLVQLLLKLAENNRCGAVEIRGGVGCESMALSESCHQHRMHSFATLPLVEEPALWRKSLTHDARKAIKQAQKNGLEVEILQGADAVRDPFFSLYLISMKRLGVPPHRLEFFTRLASGFGNNLVSASVLLKGRRVAFLLGFVTGNRIQVYIIASDPDVWSLRPNDIAHWELMRWGISQGLSVFDFGSARYPGQIQFKRKWGVTFHDYSYYLIGRPGSPAIEQVHTVNSSSKLMTTASDLWRVLVPLKLTPVLGRPIRRYLTK